MSSRSCKNVNGKQLLFQNSRFEFCEEVVSLGYTLIYNYDIWNLCRKRNIYLRVCVTFFFFVVAAESAKAKVQLH